MELNIYQTEILIAIGVYILLGLSVFVTMSTGQLSLGTAGFMALGAYTASVLTLVLKWDLNIALVVAGLISSIIGVIIAFPALRLRGIYLALATLAFGEIVRVFFQNLEFTGGAVGYKGMIGTTLLGTYIWVAAIFIFAWRLYASRIGRAFHCVAQDETVAEAMGLNITLIKVAAFAIAGFIGAIGGGLYAHDAMYIAHRNFTVMDSMFMVLVVILGGMQTIWGVVLGAAIFIILPEALRFLGDWRMAIYGAFFMAILIFRPHGLLTPDLFNFLSRRRANSKTARLAGEDADLGKVAQL